MRITHITIDGPTGACAQMKRESKRFIAVTLMTPTGHHHHKVQADDAGDIWSMAEILHEALEGAPGRRGQIQVYDAAIRQLSDL
ncbi:MAG TPA: hypothetical protein PKE29_01450 [Phycisphaerales bacterium]|nr:hypothetical protein [Phycisphaerales bacterium]